MLTRDSIAVHKCLDFLEIPIARDSRRNLYNSYRIFCLMCDARKLPHPLDSAVFTHPGNQSQSRDTPPEVLYQIVCP